MPFEIITPVVQNVTPEGTNVTATVRTVTGKSLSENNPILDNGFESISQQTKLSDFTKSYYF